MKKIITKKELKYGVAMGVVAGAMVALNNTIVYLDGKLSLETLVIGGISAASMFVVYEVISAITNLVTPSR